jgi:hypothetical protein
LANIINGTDTGSGGLITTGDSSDELQLQTAEVARVTLTNTAVVVNESGADVDFRVESDTDANALFVEGSSGNVGIGTSSPSTRLDVVTTGQALKLSTAANQTHITFRDTTNSKSGFLNYNNDSLIYFRNGPTQVFNFDSSGNFSVANGNLVFSTNGTGIDFSASAGGGASSSLLDDYEEGTWTPVLQGSTTAGTYVYDTDRTNGIYIKIGKMVTVFGVYRVFSVTSAGTGDGRITGLPFTSAVTDVSWNRSPGILRVQSGPTLANNGYFCATEGFNYLVMALQGVATWATIPVTDADFVDTIWFFQITYEAA